MTTQQAQYTLNVSPDTGKPTTGSEWAGTYQWRLWRCLPGQTVAQPFAHRCVCPAASHRKGWCRPAGVWVCWLKKKKKKATVSLKVSQSQALSSACVGDKSYWLQRAAPWCCWPSAHTGPPLDMWRWLQHTASSAADTSPHITLQQNRHTQTTDDFIINNLIFPEGFWMFCLLFISFTFEEGTTTRMSLVTQKPLDFLKPWWSTEQAFIQIYLLSDI